MSHEPIRVLPATEKYGDAFSSCLRKVDRDELRALDDRVAPNVAIRETLVTASEAWMAVDDRDEIVAMWGYREFEGAIIPWMLGSEEVTHYPLSLVRFGREYVARMDRLGLPMWNFVWAENEVAQRWLEVIGFTIDRERTWETPSGGKFYRFTRGENNV